jgi:hypothetical protein
MMKLMLFDMFWGIGYLWTIYHFLREEKRDYHHGHKTWGEFFNYLSNRPTHMKIRLAFWYVVAANLYFITWPVYWMAKLIDRIMGI